jgi:uncharacterized protein (TIGR00255 family)
MLYSMTGFGKGTVEAPGLTVTAEIKTLNSKSTDLYCRLPRALSPREIELRNLLQTQLERGKIELNVTLQKTGTAESGVAVNRPLVKAYFDELYEAARQTSPHLAQNLHLPDGYFTTELYKLALTMPNAYLTEATEEGTSDEEWPAVQEAVRQAIVECQAFRAREGAVVETMFRGAIDSIEARLTEVTARDTERIPAVRERLRKAVADLVADDAFDANRFEQELVYYVEKYDISEEKIRLQTHLDYFREVIDQDGSGKKLNFLAQEIGREINTIGSKANDAPIQRYVVAMKDELEKIKEQTANVL